MVQIIVHSSWRRVFYRFYYALILLSAFLLVDLGKDSELFVSIFCVIIVHYSMMSLTRCHGTGGTLRRQTWWESHRTRRFSCQLCRVPRIIISAIPLLFPRPSHDIHTWGISTRSPTATLMAIRLPSRSRPPGPTARTLASLSFSTLDSGRKMPLAVLVSALTRWTSTRSRRGARARMERTVDCRFTLAHCLTITCSLDSNCPQSRGNGSDPGNGLLWIYQHSWHIYITSTEREPEWGCFGESLSKLHRFHGMKGG